MGELIPDDVRNPYENANALFEGVGRLYERRYHRLRPGKDDRIRNSMDEDNLRQFQEWIKHQAFDDAISRIDVLEAETERLQALGDELANLLTEARAERDQFKQQRADWKAAYEGTFDRSASV